MLPIANTVFLRISAPTLIVFVGQIYPEYFLKNPENNILVGSNGAKYNVIAVQLFINVL